MAETNQSYLPAESPKVVEDDLVTELGNALNAGQHVLWLLSGGSVVPIAVAVAKRLTMPNVRNLTLMQVDERYGPVGHENANWQALLDAGFQCPGAQCLPVLHGVSFEETVNSYELALGKALAECTMRIGLFGIGPDGHSAGMLPGSSATRETAHIVVGYQGADFLRITMTTPAIAQLDLAVVYASGPAKLDTLTQLAHSDTSIEQQPAQALKQARRLQVYSDNFPLS